MRRVIGRQHLWTVRPWFTVVILPLLLVQILATSLQHPMTAVAVVPGTAVGIALGLLGTWLTRFEVTPAGLSCTPDTRLGIALSLLLVLVLRIGYRIVTPALPGHDLDPPARDGLFGTLAGYQLTYAIGLLCWRAQVAQQRSAEH